MVSIWVNLVVDIGMPVITLNEELNDCVNNLNIYSSI